MCMSSAKMLSKCTLNRTVQTGKPHKVICTTVMALVNRSLHTPHFEPGHQSERTNETYWLCDTDFQKCVERHQCHRSHRHHVISDNHWKKPKTALAWTGPGLDLGLGFPSSRKSRKGVGPVSPSWSRRGWIELEPHAGGMTCHLLTSD